MQALLIQEDSFVVILEIVPRILNVPGLFYKIVMQSHSIREVAYYTLILQILEVV